MNADKLESDFRAAFGLFWGDGTREAFYDFFDDEALMVDEDNPNVLDKRAFVDHVNFHLDGAWESIEWKPYEPTFRVFGETGVITTYFTLRGKPTDAGFRIRHGLCSVTCYWDRGSDHWRAMTLMLDPLMGHIKNASPS